MGGGTVILQRAGSTTAVRRSRPVDREAASTERAGGAGGHASDVGRRQPGMPEPARHDVRLVRYRYRCGRWEKSLGLGSWYIEMEHRGTRKRENAQRRTIIETHNAAGKQQAARVMAEMQNEKHTCRPTIPNTSAQNA